MARKTSPLFNRPRLRQRRDRLSLDPFGGEAEFLFRRAGKDLAERVADTSQDFPQSLIAGPRAGLLLSELRKHEQATPKISNLVSCDFSEKMLLQARENDKSNAPGNAPAASHYFVLADDEALPFADNQFNLVISFMQLHWVNNLQGFLASLHRCLKPGGLFLGCFPGGQTLAALRQSFLAIEAELYGSARLRIFPAIRFEEAALLLQKAGFESAVADSDFLTVHYASLAGLYRDLKQTGENACFTETPPKGFTPRALFGLVEAHYRQTRQTEENRLAVDFETIFVHGRKSL